jgi:hypothetical protein
MARVRPLSKAGAWLSRSSGVPSPSGAMAMTERVRPPHRDLAGAVL